MDSTCEMCFEVLGIQPTIDTCVCQDFKPDIATVRLGTRLLLAGGSPAPAASLAPPPSPPREGSSSYEDTLDQDRHQWAR